MTTGHVAALAIAGVATCCARGPTDEEPEMHYEMLVGVAVIDEDAYATYRREMSPILAEYGGAFVVDVRVADVLRAPEGARFDRLFTLRFPDAAAMGAFFDDPRYQRIKERRFTPSVSSTTVLARYEVTP